MSNLIKAAVLVKQDNKFLLVQENGKHVRGLWNWLQGKVEQEESIEQCAVREAKEETGLDIQIEKKLTVLTNTFSDTKELHLYVGKIVGGDIYFPKDEIMDARFFTVAEIQQMKAELVGNWVSDTILNIEQAS